MLANVSDFDAMNAVYADFFSTPAIDQADPRRCGDDSGGRWFGRDQMQRLGSLSVGRSAACCLNDPQVVRSYQLSHKKVTKSY